MKSSNNQATHETSLLKTKQSGVRVSKTEIYPQVKKTEPKWGTRQSCLFVLRNYSVSRGRKNKSLVKSGFGSHEERYTVRMSESSI